MWNRARNYADLCECAARFMEGRLPSFPGWGAARLDEESVPYADSLARLCRSGFLTTASQPGKPRDAQGYEQRAFVAGFVDARLLRQPLPPGLRIAAARTVALARDQRGARVIGRSGTKQLELELFRDSTGGHGSIGRTALAELALCEHVTLYDPRWGRDTRLWSALEAWLSARPGRARKPAASSHRSSPRRAQSPRKRHPRPS